MDDYSPPVDWLGRMLYPKARPYERRSRMQLFYLVVGIVCVVAAFVVGMLWLLNKPGFR